MISAAEARFQSKNFATIKDVLNRANDAILEATEKGEYTCKVSINKEIKNEVRLKIKEELESYGYTVDLPMCKPNDEAYYKHARISWKE